MYQRTYYYIDVARSLARRLIAEMTYMSLVGTLSIPPFGALRLRLGSMFPPEVLSSLAWRIANDKPDIAINSALGLRLGGVPSCSMLYREYHELGALCDLIRLKGHLPIYEVLDELVPNLGVILSNMGLSEGDLLISSYRAVNGEAREEELLRLFKLYDEWGLYAHLNAQRNGRRP
ncbi:hypothetical protein [Thermoproteus tenax]|uniref:Uncharacterized protein n=1 Tax=Thermoproteus tenax (strain ATCC 35583 / DSM 2078 / JCM 9277 / NBRC 100435 / Kra 1) TaxID=768679 RepID=G4RKV5_THETK|nr:hypothetical protein [Thermoproteus tenax]CCC82200.1 hypothetical protein TTX_1573 [Thermoproteus tenax Kra 1]